MPCSQLRVCGRRKRETATDSGDAGVAGATEGGAARAGRRQVLQRVRRLLGGRHSASAGPGNPAVPARNRRYESDTYRTHC